MEAKLREKARGVYSTYMYVSDRRRFCYIYVCVCVCVCGERARRCATRGWLVYEVAKLLDFMSSRMRMLIFWLPASFEKFAQMGDTRAFDAAVLVSERIWFVSITVVNFSVLSNSNFRL